MGSFTNNSLMSLPICDTEEDQTALEQTLPPPSQNLFQRFNQIKTLQYYIPVYRIHHVHTFCRYVVQRFTKTNSPILVYITKQCISLRKHLHISLIYKIVMFHNIQGVISDNICI